MSLHGAWPGRGGGNLAFEMEDDKDHVRERWRMILSERNFEMEDDPWRIWLEQGALEPQDLSGCVANEGAIQQPPRLLKPPSWHTCPKYISCTSFISYLTHVSHMSHTCLTHDVCMCNTSLIVMATGHARLAQKTLQT